MKSPILLRSPLHPAIELASITEAQLEFLRVLKNANRNRFFFQDELTPAHQSEWFRSYRERPGDWMFIIRNGGQDVACIGYRLRGGAADLYNFLRTEESGQDLHFAAAAVDILTNYIAQAHAVPIRAQVLADNPAARWSRRRGFLVIGQGVDDASGLLYNLMEQDPARRIPCPVTVG